jgi:hypothetical protein
LDLLSTRGGSVVAANLQKYQELFGPRASQYVAHSLLVVNHDVLGACPDDGGLYVLDILPNRPAAPDVSLSPLVPRLRGWAELGCEFLVTRPAHVPHCIADRGGILRERLDALWERVRALEYDANVLRQFLAVLGWKRPHHCRRRRPESASASRGSSGSRSRGAGKKAGKASQASQATKPAVALKGLTDAGTSAGTTSAEMPAAAARARRPPRSSVSPPAVRGRVFCSEFVALFYLSIGVLCKDDYRQATPSALVALLEKHGARTHRLRFASLPPMKTRAFSVVAN